MAGLSRRMRVNMLKWLGSQSPATPNTIIYVGFSTASPGDDAAGIAEPTISTGGYTRAQMGAGGGQQIAWTTVATPAAGAAAKLVNNASVTWGGTTQGSASSAAWSTGTTPLAYLFYSESSTSTAEANFVAFGAVSTPPQVNAAGVTLTAAASALEINIDDT